MNATTIPGRRSLWRMFRWPLALALVTAVGLVSALVGDGAYDAVSWVGLGLPCITILVALWRTRGGAGQGRER